MREVERLTEHTQKLPDLILGDHVRIQNQIGSQPRKWDKSGKVVEVCQHDQYVIKVDGSGRVTLRNRKFLHRFIPFLKHTTSSTLPHGYGRPATHVHIPHVDDPSIQPEETTSSPHRVTRPSQIPITPTIPEMISVDQNPQCLTPPIPQLPLEDYLHNLKQQNQ